MSLSDKAVFKMTQRSEIVTDDNLYSFHIKDVREAVKELKDFDKEINEMEIYDKNGERIGIALLEKLKEIFGSKLI